MFLIGDLINMNGNDELPVFKNFIHKKLHYRINRYNLTFKRMRKKNRVHSTFFFKIHADLHRFHLKRASINS